MSSADMSTAALEVAMAGMEAARAAFEAASSRLGDEMSRLQETVNTANMKAQRRALANRHRGAQETAPLR